MRAALGYPAPNGVSTPQLPGRAPLVLAGVEVGVGAGNAAAAFAFDNELGAHTVTLHDFEIDSAPVSAGEFARFVDAGGYDEPQYWPSEAGRWRSQSGYSHPQRWRRSQRNEWELRWFDQWLPMPADTPAMHVNAYEAQAYCRWAGRRLPHPVEWEYAARTQAAFHWGHSVWEWTSEPFAPYPGFAPGPYREYSQPWFGSHRELRGGSFASHDRMHDRRYRNFFEPQRTDVFAGFRTVAL